MRNLWLILFCALSLACSVPSYKTSTVYNEYVIPIDSIWNLYVFDIDFQSFYGRAFIAENTIWTVKHLFTETDPGSCNDVENLGHTTVHGLDLCNNEHKINDLLFFRSKQGLKFLLIVYIEKEFYGVVPLSPLIRGESGSPVMCIKDAGVVGMVSHIVEASRNICVGGEISRIYLTKDE